MNSATCPAAFYHGDEQTLYYGRATIPDASAPTATLDFALDQAGAGTGAGRFCSIAYDEQNQIHMAFFNDNNLQPYYSRIAASGFPVVEAIESDTPFEVGGWYTSIPFHW